MLSKIKNFYYYSVNIQLNTIPKFHGKSKLFKENSLNYLSKSEADHDVFLINTKRDYYFLINALKNIFSNDKQQQSICFLYNIFINHEKENFYENSKIALENYSDIASKHGAYTEFQTKNHLNSTKYLLSNNKANRYTADTAIKDFLIQNRANLDLDFISIPLFYGLGILYSKKIIKPEIKELLSPNKIYSYLANEKFFYHIENNRTKLQMELNLIKKKLGTKEESDNKKIKDQHKAFFSKKKNYTKIIEYYFTLTNHKRKINYFKEVINHIADKKVIFFDFFETLVLRLTKPSKDIRTKTAEYACLKLMHMGFAIDIDTFKRTRDYEEKKLHAFNIQEKNNEGNFFLTIKKVIFTITKNIIEKLVNDITYYEIKNIINALFIEKETIETLLLLKKQGLLIAVCIENFFSEENIRYIASHFNINQYIDLYHIFYHKKPSKFNDNLFQTTLKKIQIDANQILYVSNKFLYSYFILKKNKITYLSYTRDNLKKYKNLNFRACNVYNRKLKIKKNYLKKTIRKLVWAENNLNDFMLLNKKTLGISNALYPIIAIFAYQVLADLSILHIKKVFFLSKDCDFIKEVFDILLNNVSLFKAIKNNIQLNVIDINKISSTCLTYTNIENIENIIKKIISQKGTLSLKNILTNVGLELSDFSEKSLSIIKRHYNTIDSQFIVTLIKSTELGTELNKLINFKKKSLEKNLSIQGVLTGEKIALIDFLDCHGTVQKNLSYLLHDYKNTEFFGFYFGTDKLNYGKNHLWHDKSTLFPGVIFSNNYPHTVNKFNEIFSHLNKLFSCIEPKLFSENKEQNSYTALQNKLKKTIISDTLKIVNLFNISNFSSEISKKYFFNNFINFIKKEKNINI